MRCVSCFREGWIRVRRLIRFCFIFCLIPSMCFGSDVWRRVGWFWFVWSDHCPFLHRQKDHLRIDIFISLVNGRLEEVPRVISWSMILSDILFTTTLIFSLLLHRPVTVFLPINSERESLLFYLMTHAVFHWFLLLHKHKSGVWKGVPNDEHK